MNPIGIANISDVAWHILCKFRLFLFSTPKCDFLIILIWFCAYLEDPISYNYIAVSLWRSLFENDSRKIKIMDNFDTKTLRGSKICIICGTRFNIKRKFAHCSRTLSMNLKKKPVKCRYVHEYNTVYVV